MDTEAIKLALVAELKELRQGAGIHKSTTLDLDRLFGAMADGDTGILERTLFDRMQNLSPEERRILVNAFGFTYGKFMSSEDTSNAAGLTSRRNWYCHRYNLAERTVTRQEDAAIEKLAKALCPVIEQDLDAYQSVIKRATPRARQSLASVDQGIPNDLLGIIRFQHGVIRQAKSASIHNLPALLDVIEETNGKLARILGASTD